MCACTRLMQARLIERKETAVGNRELTREDRAQWRELLTTEWPGRGMILALLYMAASLFLPFAERSYISLFFLVVGLAVCYFIRRSLLSLFGVVLPCLFLYTILGSALLPAAFLALVLGGAAGALLPTVLPKSRLRWFLSPAVAALLYPVAWLAGGDPWRALLVLLPLPVSICGYILLSRCTGFTRSVCMLTATLAATLGVAGVITLLLMGVRENPVTYAGDLLRDGAVRMLTEGRDALYATGVSSTVTTGLTDVAIENTAVSLVNMTPALFFIACTVTCFYLWRMLLSCLLLFGTLPKLPVRLMTFTVSPTAAIVFIVSFLVGIFSNYDHLTVAGVAANNLSLVLEPALALVGFSSFARRGQARSCLSVFLLLGLVYILLTNPGTGLALAAFYGALNILIARFFPVPDDQNHQGGES